MRAMFVLVLVISLAACNDSNNDTDPTDAGSSASGDATQGSDATSGDATSSPDAAPDLPQSFCATTNCPAETPQCAEFLERCVECTANSDCATAPRLTCETVGDGAGGDPLYECVECIDDTVCAGGTCDPATHTCM